MSTSDIALDTWGLVQPDGFVKGLMGDVAAAAAGRRLGPLELPTINRTLAFPLLALGMALPVVARAQCPDGTPPPCAGERRAATRRAPPGPAARARTFLLLPFRNVTRGEPQDWLSEGAPLMLADALGQFRELAVVSDERLLPATCWCAPKWRRPPTPTCVPRSTSSRCACSRWLACRPRPPMWPRSPPDRWTPIVPTCAA